MNLKLGIFFLNSIGDNEANLSIHFFSYHHFKDCAISSMYLEEIYFSYALSEMMKSCDKKCNQYVPLKMTCKIELTLILLKIISFLQRQKAQKTAVTPTQIKFLIFLF